MGFVEEIAQLEGKPIKKSECLFCTNYSGLFVDVVKEAYQIKVNKRIKPQDQSTCIHHKDVWLLDSIHVAGFMQMSLDSVDDVQASLLDDEKRELLFLKFRDVMNHHSSWFDIYQEAVQADKVIQEDWHNEEADRRDAQTKIDAINWYYKAKECVNLTKEYIKDLDFTFDTNC